MKKYPRYAEKMLAALLALVMIFGIAACGPSQTGGNAAAKTDTATTAAAATKADATTAATATTAAAKAGEASATGAGSKYTMSISMLGHSDTQIDTANAKETGPMPGDIYYRTNREKAESTFPDLVWEWNEWGWAETLDQKQRATIAAGTPPTNIAGEGFIPAYINAQMLQEVPKSVTDGLNSTFFAFGADGKPYAVAYKTSTFMLFYNKDLLKKCGIDPESPPKTWDEWQDMSIKITAAGNGEFWGGGIPSFPHAGGALRATPFFRQLGTDFSKDDGINLTDPKIHQTLQYIRKMNENLPPGLGNNSDEGPHWDAFQKDKIIGFVVDGSWDEANCLRNNVNVGVAPLPLPEGGQSGNCLVGTVYIGVPTGVPKEQADLFWDFYRNICLSEEQLKHWTEENLVVPLQSMIDDASLYEGVGKAAARVAVDDLHSGKYTGLAAFLKNDSQVWEIINQQVLARVTMTNDPIDKICQDAQSQIENLLR